MGSWGYEAHENDYFWNTVGDIFSENIDYDLDNAAMIQVMNEKDQKPCIILGLINIFVDKDLGDIVPLHHLEKVDEFLKEQVQLDCYNDEYMKSLIVQKDRILRLIKKCTGKHPLVNDLQKLICEFPDKDWSWIAVSMSPSITWEFVSDHPEYPWDWDSLKYNPNITEAIMLANPSYPWAEIDDFDGSDNDYHNGEYQDSDWQYMSRVASDDMVRKYPTKPWEWRELGRSSRITWDLISENLDKAWDWDYISSNENITLEIVLANMEKPWNWSCLGENTSVVPSYNTVLENPGLPWCWESLSCNPRITLKNVIAHKDKDWCYSSLSTNETLTPEFISDNIEESWDFHDLSSNPCITWKLIMENQDKNWDYAEVVTNSGVMTRNTIIANMHQVDWNWASISSLGFNHSAFNQKRIRMCQQQAKKWYSKRVLAAKIITNGCHNWIWKPMCNDGTIGIRPKLDAEFLCLE